LTHAQVLAYAYINVKFQLCSSINVQLTENSVYNRFCIERSPKMWFRRILGVRAKIFGGNPLGMQRPPIYAFSGIFGPDLTRHAVACMDIGICHRRKFGQVWGSPAPLPEVAGNPQCRKAPLWIFDCHMEKSESFCDVTPWLITGRYVLRVLYGENRPKSENWATLTPRSFATVRRREKLIRPE